METSNRRNRGRRCQHRLSALPTFLAGQSETVVGEAPVDIERSVVLHLKRTLPHQVPQQHPRSSA
ncbi:MAG TPA: hypothetical protein VE076_02770 [Nitrososphaeraceae archaeon]|nr:hypothetical protein [Nitrososphaeraceae archaeon]